MVGGWVAWLSGNKQASWAWVSWEIEGVPKKSNTIFSGIYPFWVRQDLGKSLCAWLYPRAYPVCVAIATSTTLWFCFIFLCAWLSHAHVRVAKSRARILCTKTLPGSRDAYASKKVERKLSRFWEGGGVEKQSFYGAPTHTQVTFPQEASLYRVYVRVT